MSSEQHPRVPAEIESGIQNFDHGKLKHAETAEKNPLPSKESESLDVLATHTHTDTHTRTPFCPAGTRKVKPVWILLKEETVSGSGISWDICKSAPRSRQITMPAPHRSVFYRPDALPAAQPTVSKH